MCFVNVVISTTYPTRLPGSLSTHRIVGRFRLLMSLFIRKMTSPDTKRGGRDLRPMVESVYTLCVDGPQRVPTFVSILTQLEIQDFKHQWSQKRVRPEVHPRNKKLVSERPLLWKDVRDSKTGWRMEYFLFSPRVTSTLYPFDVVSVFRVLSSWQSLFFVWLDKKENWSVWRDT